MTLPKKSKRKNPIVSITIEIRDLALPAGLPPVMNRGKRTGSNCS